MTLPTTTKCRIKLGELLKYFRNIEEILI